MTVDPPVTAHVTRRMSNTRGRDTKPEMAVRRLLHAHGRRYRVSHRAIPGLRRTVDIAFTKAKLAVFIDGCFWHRCPIHYVIPKTRIEFWASKIDGNVARDLETTGRLEEAGWTVRRFWEHEDPVEVTAAVEAVLR